MREGILFEAELNFQFRADYDPLPPVATPSEQLPMVPHTAPTSGGIMTDPLPAQHLVERRLESVSSDLDVIGALDKVDLYPQKVEHEAILSGVGLSKQLDAVTQVLGNDDKASQAIHEITRLTQKLHNPLGQIPPHLMREP